MTRTPRRAGTLRAVFVVLLVVSAVQVGWWMLDQHWFTDEVEARLRGLYQGRIAAARRLLDAGVPADEIVALLPEVVVDEDDVTLVPGIIADLAEAHRRRVQRYLWEGGFFLVVLLAALGVIGRALRDERRLRRRQDNFLAAVSHELRSPLAAIRVAADTLALRDPPADSRAEHVRRIRRNLGRLEAMIGNLLESARLEAGELALAPAQTTLSAAAAPVAAAFRERADEAGIQLRVEIPDNLDLRMDVHALRTVLRNLLENAFTAVEDRPDPSVRIIGEAVDGRVALAVHDNGCGFDSEIASRLFEKFYRPGDELRRSGRGAGLGLHIVAEIAARTDARIEAASDGDGCGARFRVSWRRHRPT